jgi:hypothetical protein
MDVLVMVGLVVTITQVIKGLITTISPNVIAVVVSVLVLAYKVLETGTPWTLNLVLILVQVIMGAIGSFKVAQQVLKPTV